MDEPCRTQPWTLETKNIRHLRVSGVGDPGCLPWSSSEQPSPSVPCHLSGNPVKGPLTVLMTSPPQSRSAASTLYLPLLRSMEATLM